MAVQTVAIDAVPADAIILDVGPATVQTLSRRVPGWRTLVWNGSLGASEIPPFDAATTGLALTVAKATQAGRLTIVAGGGGGRAGSVHLSLNCWRYFPGVAGGQDPPSFTALFRLAPDK